jgi:hypothetical protein
VSEMDLLEKYGIKKIFTKEVKSLDEALEIANKFPSVVLKVSTSLPVHKTELGFVKLNVTKENLKTEYEDLINKIKKEGIEYSGIIVQEMAKPGIEMICGLKEDPQFGTIILFGFGGIYTEIFRDISMRVIPIGKTEAIEMIEELKYKNIFTARGRNYNKEKMVDLILRVNEIAKNEKEIKELDLNPIIFYEDDYVVVDWRAVIE